MQTDLEELRAESHAAASRNMRIGHYGFQAADEIAGLRAEIERMQAERDQFERDAGRLRLAAYEATTNGRWTEGEQCGEWAISADVYETLRDAIADEQSKEPTT